MTSLLNSAALAVAGALGIAGATAAHANEVNVYTYRESKLIQPLFDAFTKDTGIKVNVISASSGLEQRIKTEGANSPADVLLTVDIGRLEDAVQNGITQPIKSKAIDKAVPAQYRDPEGHWCGSRDARPRGLRLEGARAAERDHLRGARRSEVEGQDLHPLRPAHVQQRAVRRDDRQARRGQGRGMAARASRPIWRRSRRAATARPRATSRPASATSASATPTTGR